jgi:chemotaxis response regulator CheB/chemotaxis methyl-accepting protein methylase
MFGNEGESRDVVMAVIREVAGIVSEMSGIQLGERQYSMIESRLKSRIIKLELHTFSRYIKYLKRNLEAESQTLLSLITTHHTYFFREFLHFEYLLNKGLKRLIDRTRARGEKVIRIWSAAASRGQEAYSLAMFFDFHLKAIAPDLTFEIWGTDVDPESIATAKNGVYRVEDLRQSPAMYLQDQWVRGKGDISEFTKAKESLKKKCHFKVENLLKCEGFLNGKMFDLIFCRNVFIYFNPEQIKKITNLMLNHLDPQGLLFLGASETLTGIDVKVESTGTSVYQHRVDVPKDVLSGIKSATAYALGRAMKPAEAISRPLEVLCVDDSGVIISLLKKILTKESGFIVKATARNGVEAMEKLRADTFDFITLDLHMPEMDGVTFLKETQFTKRPPVLVISSVNREDLSIGKKALEYGASDYVEKPSLENVAQAGNEIRSKIKSILSMQKQTESPGRKAAIEVPGALSTAPTEVADAGRELKVKKVLIVDDSKTIRQILNKIISEDPGLKVVAEAERPSQVEALIVKHKPDVITLDIQMPEMDGVALLKIIHPKYHIPTVMISAISKEEGPQVLQALEAGAIDYIQKPQLNDLDEVSKVIRERINIAAGAKIRRRTASPRRSAIKTKNFEKQSLIVLGASTGGTEAIREILQSLPSAIPPILIVQHIPPVFSTAFANRLNDLCLFKVHEAKDGEEVLENNVYIAPGGTQMGVRAEANKLVIQITDEAPVNRHKPSVDYLFQSVAQAKLSRLTAVILTGMGGDGSKTMKVLRDQGAHTIAQNEETCVIFGMPKEAIKLGGAEFVLGLDEIAQKMLDLSLERPVRKIG